MDSRITGLMTKWILCLFFAAACTVSQADVKGYMQLHGQNQGDIEGDCTLPGREGFIEVHEVTHLVEVPIDQATGQITGSRQHKPLVVRKRTEKSSPKICQALTSGERCRVELRLFRTLENGQEQHYYTIVLEDALVAAYHPATLADDDHLHEEVAFVYRQITWTYVPEGIEAQDDIGGLSP